MARLGIPKAIGLLICVPDKTVAIFTSYPYFDAPWKCMSVLCMRVCLCANVYVLLYCFLIYRIRSFLHIFPEFFFDEHSHRLGFLGLKLILVAYSRHASVRLRLLTATLTKLALSGRSGIQLWKFFDFLTTHRPPLFVHLLPFIRFKVSLST